MMKHANALIFTILCMATGPVMAGLDVNINDHALRGTFDYLGDPRNKEVVTDAGLLYAEPAQGNSTVVLHLGLNSGSNNLRLGLRAILANPDGGDVLALGLGGQGRLPLTPTISFSGHFYYAPQITSTLDGDGYRELQVQFNFRVNHADDIYVGYRSLEVKLDGVTEAVEIDEDLILGFKLNF